MNIAIKSHLVIPLLLLKNFHIQIFIQPKLFLSPVSQRTSITITTTTAIQVMPSRRAKIREVVTLPPKSAPQQGVHRIRMGGRPLTAPEMETVSWGATAQSPTAVVGAIAASAVRPAVLAAEEEWLSIRTGRRRGRSEPQRQIVMRLWGSVVLGLIANPFENHRFTATADEPPPTVVASPGQVTAQGTNSGSSRSTGTADLDRQQWKQQQFR